MEVVAMLAGGTTGLVVLIGYGLYKAFKNSRCRSSCCGKVMSMSVHMGDEEKKDAKEVAPGK
jgi:hypothetical protein